MISCWSDNKLHKDKIHSLYDLSATAKNITSILYFLPLVKLFFSGCLLYYFMIWQYVLKTK